MSACIGHNGVLLWCIIAKADSGATLLLHDWTLFVPTDWFYSNEWEDCDLGLQSTVWKCLPEVVTWLLDVSRSELRPSACVLQPSTMSASSFCCWFGLFPHHTAFLFVKSFKIYSLALWCADACENTFKCYYCHLSERLKNPKLFQCNFIVVASFLFVFRWHYVHILSYITYVTEQEFLCLFFECHKRTKILSWSEESQQIKAKNK